MQTRLGLFNTNQVNPDGFAIPVDGLLSYVSQTWEAGLPMFVGARCTFAPVGLPQLLLMKSSGGALG